MAVSQPAMRSMVDSTLRFSSTSSTTSARTSLPGRQPAHLDPQRIRRERQPDADGRSQRDVEDASRGSAMDSEDEAAAHQLHLAARNREPEARAAFPAATAALLERLEDALPHVVAESPGPVSSTSKRQRPSA